MLRAVVWDVDGTLAETERDGHRIAFNRAFEAHGLARRWDVATYGRLLDVAGGLERLRHDLRTGELAACDDATIDALTRRLHRTKNEAYAALIASGGIALRAGVRRVLDACADENVLQAIATTTSRSNVDVLLASALGPRWAERFAAIVCAEDAPVKKPDPMAYRIALARLGVAADEAIAIEDSPNGVASARAAGLAVLVTRSAYFGAASYDATVATCDDLESPVNAPAHSPAHSLADTCGLRADRIDVDVLRHLRQQQASTQCRRAVS